jgi:hypothetical protein
LKHRPVTEKLQKGAVYIVVLKFEGDIRRDILIYHVTMRAFYLWVRLLILR